MTTFAPDETVRRIEELSEREREAWQSYQDGLRDLDGRAYDEAEAEAWTTLERALQEVATERAELESAAPSGD